MKFLFLILFINFSFSQNNEDRQIFDILLSYNKSSNYAVCTESDGHNKMIEIIKNRRHFYQNCPSDTFRLSRKERKYIVKEINTFNKYKFSADLFPKIKMISKDTLMLYSANQEIKWRRDYAEVRKSNDTIKIAQFFSERGETPFEDTCVNFFSKPIYIRNNKVCIVYYAQFYYFHKELGGCDFIQILIKRNNFWEKYY